MTELEEIREQLENFTHHTHSTFFRVAHVEIMRQSEDTYRFLVWGRELARIWFDGGYPVHIDVAKPYQKLLASQSPNNKSDLIAALAQLQVAASKAEREHTSFVIEELRLRHFRAFEDARLPFSSITALIGENGSGKSSLLDAVALMRYALSEPLENTVNRFGGVDAIRQRCTKNGNSHEVSLALVARLASPSEPEKTLRVLYGFGLVESREGGIQVTREVLTTSDPNAGWFERSAKQEVTSSIPDLSPVIAPDALLFPTIAGRHQLWAKIRQELGLANVYRIDPDAMRPVQTGGATWFNLSPDGRNACDILRQIGRDESRRHRLLERIAAVTPGIVDIGVKGNGRQQWVYFEQRNGLDTTQAFDAFSMSDGTLRALGVLLALEQKQEPSLLMFDEIEESMHPAALAILIDALASSAERSPVAFTTHNPEALNHPAITGENVRVVRWKEGISRVYSLRDSVIQSLTPPESIGELYRDNALFTADEPLTNPDDFYGVSE